MKLKEFLSKKFDFNLSQTKTLWKDINDTCFGGKLTQPLILIEDDLNHLVPPEYADKFGGGDVLGYCDEDPDDKKLVLLFSSKIEDASEMMEVVAHEMVHQALAEKLGYDEMCKVGHGQDFMSYAPAIKKYHGVELTGASI